MRGLLGRGEYALQEMGGGCGVLKHGDRLFVELLAGANAGEFDLDVFVRPQAR